VLCREFDRRDDANAWRKSTKEVDKHKIFYYNLESKNLSKHLRHHRTNWLRTPTINYASQKA